MTGGGFLDDNTAMRLIAGVLGLVALAGYIITHWF